MKVCVTRRSALEYSIEATEVILEVTINETNKIKQM